MVVLEYGLYMVSPFSPLTACPFSRISLSIFWYIRDVILSMFIFENYLRLVLISIFLIRSVFFFTLVFEYMSYHYHATFSKGICLTFFSSISYSVSFSSASSARANASFLVSPLRAICLRFPVTGSGGASITHTHL